MKLVGRLLTLGAVLVGGSALAAPVQISVIELPGIIEPPGKGVYYDVLQDVAKGAGLEFEIGIKPMARVFDDLNNGRAQCILPGLSDGIKVPHVSGKPFNGVNYYIYTPEGAPLISSLEGLAGKRVGKIHGFTYSPEIDNATHFTAEAGKDEETNIKKMRAGRLDAIIGAKQDVDHALGNLGGGLSFDPAKPVFKVTDNIACADNEVGRAVIQATDTVFGDMLASGEMKKALGWVYGEP